MNATVITTGPGVIMATATASRNCRSLSQWKCSTTPPRRKGTIASPLPNTKTPASPKYPAIRRTAGHDATPWTPANIHDGVASENTDDLASLHPGGVRTNQTSTPLKATTQTTSFSVQAVRIAFTPSTTHRSQSRPTDLPISLNALRAI